MSCRATQAGPTTYALSAIPRRRRLQTSFASSCSSPVAPMSLESIATLNLPDPISLGRRRRPSLEVIDVDSLDDEEITFLGYRRSQRRRLSQGAVSNPVAGPSSVPVIVLDSDEEHNPFFVNPNRAQGTSSSISYRDNTSQYRLISSQPPTHPIASASACTTQDYSPRPSYPTPPRWPFFFSSPPRAHSQCRPSTSHPTQ